MNRAAVARTGLSLARRALWSGGRPRQGVLPVMLMLLLAGASVLALTVLFGSAAAAQVPKAVHVNLLGWAFTLAMLMLVVGDLHAVVSAAVTAPDLELLRAAPLSARQILGLKLAATLPRTLPPVLAIALPSVLAYGYVNGSPSAPAFLLVLAGLWALPLALGTLLAIPLLRLAPAAHLREPLALLATLAFIAGWVANTFWVPRLASDSLDLAAALRALPAPPDWSPATWAAHAIAGGRGAASALAEFSVLVFAALAAASAVAGELFEVVMSRSTGTLGRVSRASARRAPSLARAFLRRDAALATRDWPVTLDALAGLALWTLLPLAILPLAPLAPLSVARDMVIALSVSLGHDFAARALPLERDSVAWARLSPVGGARWMRLRALGLGLAALGMVGVAVLIVALVFRLSPAGAADVAVFACAAAITTMATGLLSGARFGESAWTDPRAMLAPGGRLVSAIVSVALAGAWLTLAHRHAATPVSLGTALAMLAAAVAFALIPLALAARSLERREYSGR